MSLVQTLKVGRTAYLSVSKYFKNIQIINNLHVVCLVNVNEAETIKSSFY